MFDIKQEAARLVAQMTLEEKVFQMLHTAPAVKRLGIPSYNWWNEALHGVARAGVATMLPQAIGLARPGSKCAQNRRLRQAFCRFVLY